MLPLRIDHYKKKKRKTSSIDQSMWSDSQSSSGRVGGVVSALPLSSTSGAVSSLSRNRALLIMMVVMGVMFFSMSSTSFLQSSTNAANSLRSSGDATNSAVVVRGNNQIVNFGDGVAATPRPHVRRVEPASSHRPDSFAIVVVADLDKQSKDAASKKPTFYSYLQHGTLKITRRSGGGGITQQDDYAVSWGDSQKFTTTMNEAGRGFELSELAWFHGKLLSFDDRTGIVYHLKNFEGGTKPLQAIPQHIIMEGDGLAGKGQKHEWATVKDDELYMGSVGKEFTDNAGNILSDSNLWVAVLDVYGNVRHEDWSAHFARVRKALGCDYPGYVIHEAIEWSSVHRKWFILPRRVSQEPYNDELDEMRGSNKVVIASEDFSSIEVLSVGKVTPLRGFSSFKFVPRTDDSVIVAVKSVEVEATQTQTSFLTVFDIRGNVLLDETELPGGHKYEGIAFAHDWA